MKTCSGTPTPNSSAKIISLQAFSGERMLGEVRQKHVSDCEGAL